MTFRGRGLVQLTGKHEMSKLLNKAGSTPLLSVANMPVGAGAYTVAGEYPKSARPANKVSLTVFDAVGGYIVEIDNGYNNEGELYIIGEDQDLGQEIGKIITHKKLKT